MSSEGRRLLLREAFQATQPISIITLLDSSLALAAVCFFPPPFLFTTLNTGFFGLFVFTKLLWNKNDVRVTILTIFKFTV